MTLRLIFASFSSFLHSNLHAVGTGAIRRSMLVQFGGKAL
jgi:hypothetical protein